MIDDESLVKTRTNTCLSYTSAVPSYSVVLLTAKDSLKQHHAPAQTVLNGQQQHENTEVYTTENEYKTM